MGLRMMVVGAHGADPFDLAGGAMAKYVQAGHEVMVVALSLGARSHAMKAGGIAELRRIKRDELHRAADRLGVQHVRSLEYEDDPLDLGREALTAIVELVREFKPDIVVSHHVSGEWVPDHSETGKLVKHACHCAGRPGFTSSRPVHVVRNQFSFGLGVIHRGQHVIGAPPALPAFYIDVSDVIDRKFEAMMEFTTQQYTAELMARRKEAFEGHYGFDFGVGYAEPYYCLRSVLLNAFPLTGGRDNFGRTVEGMEQSTK